MGTLALSESINQDPGCSLRVGLFGGTFNPIHCGHTQVAKDVMQIYRLAAIHFLPSALPPHKAKGGLATAADRYEMARMALADEPAFGLSDVEIQRDGPSYTIDTLRHVRDRQRSGVEFFFILGLDAFLEIHTWKSFQQLFDLAAFIVMARLQNRRSVLPWRASVVEFAQQRISADYRLSTRTDTLIHPQKKPIYLASVTPVAISSSRIREMIRLGQSVQAWVDPAVADYIERKGLYR